MVIPMWLLCMHMKFRCTIWYVGSCKTIKTCSALGAFCLDRMGPFWQRGHFVWTPQLQNFDLEKKNLLLLITYAGSCWGVDSVTSCVCDCMSVCLCSDVKTAWAIYTKVGANILYDLRSESQRTVTWVIGCKLGGPCVDLHVYTTA